MSLWNDLHHTSRSLLREPGFTAVAILTIAFGVGANTAIFSIVNAVLLRPLPYRDPERLVALHEVIPAVAHLYPMLPASARHFTEWRERSTAFESLSAIMPASANLTGTGEPERVDAARVSANFFDTLGVQPSLGRGFLAGEDQEGRDRVVVISDSLWRRRFQTDPAIAGRTIMLDAQAHVVAGVLPASFRFPAEGTLGTVALGDRPEVFRPLVFPPDHLKALMGTFNYGVVARLRKGVTRKQALAELNVIAAQLVKLSGEKVELRAAVLPLRDAIVGKTRRGLLVLLGAVGSVLLIVCVNLANLTLARGERKSRESAIRMALGASGGRLLRQALAESLLLAFGGGALGAGIAAAGLGALIRGAPTDIPRLGDVTLDGRVLLFALAITSVTGLLFGLAPAWRAARTDPQSALKSGARSATRAAGGLRGLLVTVEVGLSAMLLLTATLLMSSFARLMRADKGFSAPSVLATEVVIPTARYGGEQQRNSFHERLLADLASRPGILSAAITTALPLQGETWVDSVSVPRDSRPIFQRPPVNVRFVSPDYLRTMGIPLLAGRAFTDNDRQGKVAVISERLARTLWPDQDPIGRRFQRGDDLQQYEVVGIAGDVRANTDKRPVAMWYRPYWEWAPSRVMLVARTAGDPRSIAGTIRAAVRTVDADVPLREMRTMQEILDQSVAQRRFQMLLAASFAATALLLASLGIYGVVSYSVTRRTNEIGIRTALGAQKRNIYLIVLRQAMTPVALGLLAGLGGAVAAGRVLATLLYEVSPRDPFAIGAVALLLAAVGLAACFGPAHRATGVDPLVALRYE